jgi:hypothetical protein
MFQLVKTTPNIFMWINPLVSLALYLSLIFETGIELQLGQIKSHFKQLIL